MNNRGSHQNNADSSDGSGDDADAVAGVGGPFADASQSPLSGGDPPSLTDADGGVTQFSYNASGNLASLTDPDQNTTTWSYNSQNNVTQQTDSQGNSAAFAYNSSGQLVSYTDMDGNVRTYQYDSAGHVIAETLYASAADAAAGQNAEDTLDYAYDSSGNLTSESDDDSSDTYTYDSENRLASATETSLDAPTVVLAYQYSGTGTQPSGVAATIGGVADYQDAYTYNSQGQLTAIARTAASAAATPWRTKRSTWPTMSAGQVADDRPLRERPVGGRGGRTLTTPPGRLVGLVYDQGTTVLASYTYSYAASATSSPPGTDGTLVAGEGQGTASSPLLSGEGQGTASSPLLSGEGQGTASSPLLSGEGQGVRASWLPGGATLPADSTQGINTAELDQAMSPEELIASVTSLDGSVAYSYDAEGQLTAASYSPLPPGEGQGEGSPGEGQGEGGQTGGQTQPNESYSYDANGNRTSSTSSAAVVIGTGNELLFDGTYTYTYDADGNCTAKFIDVHHTGVLSTGDTDVTQYTWDADSRLVQVTTSATFGSVTQIVSYLYDAEGRWIGENIENGSGVVTQETASSTMATRSSCSSARRPRGRWQRCDDQRGPQPSLPLGSGGGSVLVRRAAYAAVVGAGHQRVHAWHRRLAAYGQRGHGA